MNKLDIFKGASELLVSIGVGSIVGNAIKLTTDPSAGRIKKIAIGFGGFVLSSMVTDLANTYANKTIDTAVENISKLIKPIKDEVEEKLNDIEAVEVTVDIGNILEEDEPVIKVEKSKTIAAQNEHLDSIPAAFKKKTEED